MNTDSQRRALLLTFNSRQLKYTTVNEVQDVQSSHEFHLTVHVSSIGRMNFSQDCTVLSVLVIRMCVCVFTNSVTCEVFMLSSLTNHRYATLFFKLNYFYNEVPSTWFSFSNNF